MEKGIEIKYTAPSSKVIEVILQNVLLGESNPEGPGAEGKDPIGG